MKIRISTNVIHTLYLVYMKENQYTIVTDFRYKGAIKNKNYQQ